MRCFDAQLVLHRKKKFCDNTCFQGSKNRVGVVYVIHWDLRSSRLRGTTRNSDLFRSFIPKLIDMLLGYIAAQKHYLFKQ